MADKKSFQELVDDTTRVIHEFEKVEKRKWDAEASTLELIKQVGELSKNVLAHEGYYMAGRDKLKEFDILRDNIADELSDILYMIIRISNHYSIDLETAHYKALDEALNHPLMKVGAKK